jgi:hypothetical protein
VHALLGGGRFTELGDELPQSLAPTLPGPRASHFGTHINIVVQLYPPRAVQLDLLEGLAHDIVRLVLRLLRGFNDGGLVEVALVVDVELPKGVLQAKDVALLELRVFPARIVALAAVEGAGGAWKLHAGRRTSAA